MRPASCVDDRKPRHGSCDTRLETRDQFRVLIYYNLRPNLLHDGDGDGDTAALDTLREYYCTVQCLFPTGFRLHLHQHLLQLQQVDVLALLYVLGGLHGAR